MMNVGNAKMDRKTTFSPKVAANGSSRTPIVEAVINGRIIVNWSTALRRRRSLRRSS